MLNEGDEAPQQNGCNCLVRGSSRGVITSTEGKQGAQRASGVNLHAREVTRLPGVRDSTLILHRRKYLVCGYGEENPGSKERKWFL